MNKVCVLCQSSTDDVLEYGEFKRTKGVAAHYFCALMSTSITQSGKDNEGILGFLEKDIKIVAEKCKNNKCAYCGGLGATINCFNKSCKKNFHFPCGLQNKCSFKFSGQYKTFCKTHNHYPKISKKLIRNMRNMQCIACLDDIEKSERATDFLATICCKRHLLHVKCGKKLAFNAGYFTKCPICNDTDHFPESLRNCGIFIPLQDASWEQPRGAYSELACIPQSCDINECMCPRGKDYKGRVGPWKFLLCSDCGSSAAHKGCINDGPYICDTCFVVDERVNVNDNQAKRMKFNSPNSSNPH